MTDITQLARDAGFRQYAGSVDLLLCGDADDFAKLEALLRGEFIKELGEPVGKVIRKTELTPHGNPMNVVDVLLYKTKVLGEVGTLLYALQKKG